MDELTYTTLSNYFTRLTSVGYVSYSNIPSLLALIYVYYFKDKYNLNDKENTIVDKALYCLQGSNCLIPYNKGNC